MNKTRLLALADHLESGQLIHKVFDVGVVNDNRRYGPITPNGCGTHGCAMGEIPAVFPDQWVFDRAGSIKLMAGVADASINQLIRNVAAFFDVSERQVLDLFFPRELGGGSLSLESKKEDVAANIRRHVQK